MENTLSSKAALQDVSRKVVMLCMSGLFWHVKGKIRPCSLQGQKKKSRLCGGPFQQAPCAKSGRPSFLAMWHGLESVASAERLPLSTKTCILHAIKLCADVVSVMGDNKRTFWLSSRWRFHALGVRSLFPVHVQWMLCAASKAAQPKILPLLCPQGGA
eukprot:1160962-Pelagomonas_calceolata.AAC.5